MTEDQIKHMVDRFLGWKLPENFQPDGGIIFQKHGNPGTPHEYNNEPTGTNVIDATQADAMVRYMIEGMPMTTVDELRKEALPTGVYWSCEAGNFYDAKTNVGMGLAFYREWKDSKDRFPEVATTSAGLDLYLTKPVNPVAGTR